jgi:hypothetical protein
MAVDAEQLLVFENGPGAINLPLVPSQLGAQCSRSVHPTTGQLFERLISALSGAPFQVRLPHLLETKAELCRRLRDTPFADLAALTVSCDGFPQRSEARQCGACSSCVLRRQAMWTSDLAETSDCYRIDLLEPGASLDRAGALEMIDQVGRIQAALGARVPWAALLAEFPELLEVEAVLATSLGQSEAREALVALYRRYSAEWEAFPPAQNLLHAA